MSVGLRSYTDVDELLTATLGLQSLMTYSMVPLKSLLVIFIAKMAVVTALRQKQSWAQFFDSFI